MADEVLKEDDDDITVIETVDEKIPAPRPEGDEEDSSRLEAERDDDEDARLGDNEDDDDPNDKTAKNRAARQLRKERRAEAERRAKDELSFLRSQNQTLEQRLAALEGNTVNTAASQIEAQLVQTQREIEQAEYILAKATEAANGEDVVAALRLRDDAVTKRTTLNGYRESIEQTRVRQAQPQIDPRVVNYAQQWTAANPWFDPQGSDEDSRITKAIDDGLVKEGYNPSGPEYWHELTKRVNGRLGGEAEAEAPRRRVPPQGATREHAPSSTRNEVYVTPERKKAMVDAGIWDDPARRKRMLKSYQEYDRQNSAN